MKKPESLDVKAEKFAGSDKNYTIRDGIAYCNTCGEARQTWKDFGPGKKLVWCACKCLEEKAAGKDNSERMEKLQQRGGVSPKYTFDRAQPSRVMDVCRRYATRWDEAAENGAGLLLWGGVGTGKTFAAHCIANELIKRDKHSGANVVIQCPLGNRKFILVLCIYVGQRLSLFNQWTYQFIEICQFFSPYMRLASCHRISFLCNSVCLVCNIISPVKFTLPSSVACIANIRRLLQAIALAVCIALTEASAVHDFASSAAHSAIIISAHFCPFTVQSV